MTSEVEVRYRVELTQHEEGVFNAGRRAAFEEMAEWARKRRDELGFNAISSDPLYADQRVGRAGHLHGLGDCELEANRRAREL